MGSGLRPAVQSPLQSAGGGGGRAKHFAHLRDFACLAGCLPACHAGCLVCVRRKVAIRAILVPQNRRARISVDLRPRGTAGQCEQAEHHQSTVVMRSTLFTRALHKAWRS